MTIPWAQIFEIVLKMIENCEPEPAARVGLLRRPRGLQALRFEHSVREAMNISPREWRRTGKGIMEEIYAERDAATDEDLKMLLEPVAAA